MQARHLVLSLVSAVGLMGCAGQRPLTDAQYEEAGRDIAAMNTCVAKGHMSTHTGAIGAELIRGHLAQRPHDSERLASEISTRSARPQTIESCRALEVKVLSANNRVNSQRQQAADMHQAGKAFSDSMQNARPKQTVCNRLGTQVFCSTY